MSSTHRWSVRSRSVWINRSKRDGKFAWGESSEGEKVGGRVREALEKVGHGEMRGSPRCLWNICCLIKPWWWGYSVWSTSFICLSIHPSFRSICSSIHPSSFIHSFIHSFVRSFSQLIKKGSPAEDSIEINQILVQLRHCCQFRFFCHSFIHSFIHSFTHSLVHSLIHPSIHPFIHSFIHSFTHSSIHSFIRSHMHACIGRSSWFFRFNQFLPTAFHPAQKLFHPPIGLQPICSIIH